MIKELIVKIELQSILVLALTLIAGYLLLKMDNSLSSPAGILGTGCISLGLIYTLISFFSNQIRESYKDVIGEYKQSIQSLRTSSKAIQESYGNALEIKKESARGNVGGYVSQSGAPLTSKD